MLKLSKKTHFNFFIALTILFGVTLIFQIIEYNSVKGNFFSQFRLSFLGLSLTLVQMFNYLNVLRKEK